MSKLQELTQELCPNGVEYKKMGDMISIYTGTQFNKRDMSTEGRYPVINGGVNPSGYIEEYNEDLDTITISQGGASAGYVSWQEEKFWAGAHCYVIRPSNVNLLNRYLYFFLKNQEDYLRQMQHGAGIPALSRKKVQALEIPIPPLEVQEEIVKILDRFAEYAAELQAELQARQEQYEFYRDKLLSFNNINKGGGGHASVTWMKMSEIGRFIRGNGLQKKDFTESGVPCIHYGQIYTHYGTFASKTKSFVNEDTAKRCKKAHSGDLIFATVSENIEDVCKCVAWLGDDEICISGDSLAFYHNQNPKYLAYYFQTTVFADYKRTRVTGTKVIRLHQSKLEQFVIPIPSLAEQQHIVDILNRFETLTNDLAQGLPAEINAVHEQYKYYRNRLLSFPRNKLSA